MVHRYSSVIGLTILSMASSGCGLGSANLRPAPGASLADCGSAPRCVASVASDPDKRIEPFSYSGSRESARRRLLAVLGDQPRLKLIESTENYLHAEAATPVMRYVDDLEFLFSDSAQVIDVRSSSRIGYYDFGTNRERLRMIRQAFSSPPLEEGR